MTKKKRKKTESFILTCLTSAFSVVFFPKHVQRRFDFKSKPRVCLIDDGKIARERAEQHADELSRCEALSVSKCSFTSVLKCRVVSHEN